MNKFITIILIFIVISTSAYCEDKNIFSLIFSGGLNYGCITTADDEVDAITSASKIGGHGSVHTEIDISGHFLETGLDYFYSSKEVTFDDLTIDGTRLFSMHNIALPILYNFHFIKRDNKNPYLVCGIGIYGSYSLYQDINDSGVLPDYDLKKWTAGLYSRICYYPVEIEDTYLLGLYVNLWRSMFNQYYTDDYHKDWLASELAVFQLGLTMKF